MTGGSVLCEIGVESGRRGCVFSNQNNLRRRRRQSKKEKGGGSRLRERSRVKLG
jgi:hypothetical protein